MASIQGYLRLEDRPGAFDPRAACVLLVRAMHSHGPHRTLQDADAHAALSLNLRPATPEDLQIRSLPLLADGCRLAATTRLDNRAELLALLGRAGPDSISAPDLELLGHAWERWGEACLDRLVGAFALAVWNPARRELTLARDHTGERPLFYHRGHGFFAFSSMPKGLLALPGVDRGVDESTLLDALTLARYPQTSSFFKGIDRVAPGHLVRVRDGQVEVRAYWRPFEAPAVHFRRDEDYVERFLEIFDAAVAARLRSTGGIGATLSAGLDSSSVSSSAARLLAARGERLTCFTSVPRPGFLGLGFPGRMPDEGPGARDVAAMYPNIDHVLLTSEGMDLVATVQRLSDAVDEPVQNSVNNLWIAAILQQCRERGISTLLTAMLGNLTISHAGMEALGEMLRGGRWLRLARTAHSFRKRGLVSYRRSFGEATQGLLPAALHRAILRAGEFSLSYSAVNRGLTGELRLREKMLGEFFPNRHDVRKERLDLWQLFDLDTYQAGLEAVHGVEIRDPCMDRRVMEFCFAIPSEQYVVGGVPRSLVRRAMRDRLPAATLSRTTRGQQAADWYLTVREALPQLAEQIAANERSPVAQRLLDLPRLRELASSMPDTSLESMDASFGWCDALCRGFSFGYFMRRREPVAVNESLPLGAEDRAPQRGSTSYSTETISD